VISNKFAYESNNSVYFDVSAYKKDGRFLYGILEPGLCNNEQLLKEGEGALSCNQQNEKRSPQDFALWKKSKENEPKWESPWGEGRPGWHVECSAMAESVFEFPVDLHSGGVDLKFPHHTNELA
jgi:cysteinyl-tRNA synthetase